MAWSGSAVFKAFILAPLVEGTTTTATGYTGLDTDTVKVSLFNDTITPAKDVAVGETGYAAAAGIWDTGGVSDTNWPAAGNALVNDTFSGVTNAVMYDADNLSHTGTVTLSNAVGCLVYDDTITAGTVADQGVCYNWFGGAQSVTAGTFTIVWHANGIFRITV
jgi:hypothetical protein